MSVKAWVGLLGFGVTVLGWADSDRIVYREKFEGWRNPEQYLRIAKGVKRWEVIREGGEVFLRVHACPTATRPEILVVWDLAPIQFRKLSLEIRPNAAEAEAEMYLQVTWEDRSGVGYAGRFFGAGTKREGRGSLQSGKWNFYGLAIPQDLLGASRGGKELLSETGDVLGAEPNFSNAGYKTLYLNFSFPAHSPLLGKEFTLDLKNLTLTELVPAQE